jgi:hypothetical protein
VAGQKKHLRLVAPGGTGELQGNKICDFLLLFSHAFVLNLLAALRAVHEKGRLRHLHQEGLVL